MKARNLFISLIVLLSIGLTSPIIAQVSGGRKKEHRNQRGGGISLFKRHKSGGHADAFAKGGHKSGFLSKLFKGKSGSSWVYKKTKPGWKQNKEQAQLFTRNRTSKKRYIDGILARQNKQRARERERGSNFSKRRR